MKKPVTLLLALFLLLTMLPVRAAEIVDSGTCGENLTWTLDSDGQLTISGTGEMANFDWEGSPWYENEKIKSLVLTQGVTTIGDDALRGCNNLTSMKIPDSVTSIGNWTFALCENLTTVIIPDSVTRIGDSTFRCCRGLTSVTIGNSVSVIGGGAFAICNSLTNVTVQPGNKKYHSEGNCVIETASKSIIFGCKTSVIPTDGSVTRIGDEAFNGCSGLTSITIPDSITSVGQVAFADCSTLTQLIIPNSVTRIEWGSFIGCSSLANIIIPASVTEIGEEAIPETTVIYGEADSYVQTWAKENNREFRLIDELMTLSAPETAEVKVGEETAVEITADYAAGKTVSVAADSENVTVSDSKVTLDDEGKAAVTITGKAAGETTLTFTLDGTDKTAATKVTVSVPEQPARVPGDVSGDGQTTAEDARLSLRAAVGLETYEPGSPEFLAADATKDGAITAEDARLILRAAVGLETLA